MGKVCGTLVMEPLLPDVKPTPGVWGNVTVVSRPSHGRGGGVGVKYLTALIMRSGGKKETHFAPDMSLALAQGQRVCRDSGCPSV